MIPPRPDSGLPGFPPPPRPPHRRRFIALALVISLVAPGVLAVAALVPWSDSPEAYDFLARRGDGEPYRWEPCRPIHYEVNLEHAPPYAMADVTEAVARITRASGVRFVLDGRTERTPEEQQADDFRDPVTSGVRPVLIAWLPGSTFSRYADPSETAGFGLPVAGLGSEPWVYGSGLVVINADAPLSPGFGHSSSLGPVLMHELGHVLGLGHVGDGGEIMWAPDEPGGDVFAPADVTDWGNGDLAGLREVGRPAGCIHSSLPARMAGIVGGQLV